MRGPGLRLGIDVRRLWRCPACGTELPARGSVTSVLCRCETPHRFMQLVEPRRTVRPEPEPLDIYFECAPDDETEAVVDITPAGVTADVAATEATLEPEAAADSTTGIDRDDKLDQAASEFSEEAPAPDVNSAAPGEPMVAADPAGDSADLAGTSPDTIVTDAAPDSSSTDGPTAMVETPTDSNESQRTRKRRPRRGRRRRGGRPKPDAGSGSESGGPAPAPS